MVVQISKPGRRQLLFLLHKPPGHLRGPFKILPMGTEDISEG
jgi:hypothetical protein